MVGRKKKSNAIKKAEAVYEYGCRKGKGRLGKYKVFGGPYHNKTLLLATCGTFVFSVGKWFGRYNENGAWEDRT